MCGLGLALWLGCAGPDRAPTGTLTIGLDTAPLSLDPRFSSDATSSQIEELLFEGLTRIDDRQGRSPNLASAWTQPDDRTYVFHVRRGARFADGAEVEAEDVAATYRSVLHAGSLSPKREALSSIDAIEVLDTHTLRFRLAAPHAGFLAATGLGILPRQQAAAAALRPLVLPRGSGPFQLERPLGGDTFGLVRNPHHGPPVPALRRLRFRVLPDAITRVLELRRGGVDLVQSGLEPDAIAWLRRLPDVRIECGAASAFQYLGMNLRDPRLADRRVRRAIAHAIDREALTSHLWNGTARPANTLLPPHHWAYFAKTPGYRFDPARSRRLLDRAGWRDPDGPGPLPRFRLRYTTTNVELRRRIAEALQAQLAAVGIELDIRSYEWATFYQDVREGNFEIYSLAWIGIEDPDLYRQIFHSSQTPPGGMNRGYYQDTRMDRLVEQGRRTLDPHRRASLYASIQIHAARQLPVVPLWWPSQCVAHTLRLRGYEPTKNGDYSGLRQARMDEG